MKYDKTIWIIDDNLALRDQLAECLCKHGQIDKNTFTFQNSLDKYIKVVIHPALKNGEHIVQECLLIQEKDVPDIVLLDLKFSTDDGVMDIMELSGVKHVLNGLCVNSKFNKCVFLLFTQLKLSEEQKENFNRNYKLSSRISDFFRKQELGFPVDFTFSDKTCEALKETIDIWTTYDDKILI